MRRVLQFALVFCVTLATSAGIAVAGKVTPPASPLPLWPMVQFDGANSSFALRSGPAGPAPSTLKLSGALTNGYDNPVIASNGTLIVASQLGISAMSPTGQVLWSATIPQGGATSFVGGAPAIGPKTGTVYAPVRFGENAIGLTAYSSTGTWLWSRQFGAGEQWGEPRPHTKVATDSAGNEVVFLPGNFQLYAFNATSKTMKWTANGYASCALSPVDNVVYVYRSGFNGRTQVAKLNRDTGVCVGAAELGLGQSPRPLSWGQMSAGPDGAVYVPTFTALTALNADMTVRWTYEPADARDDAFCDVIPVVRGDRVYVAYGVPYPGIANLKALDAATGAQVWSVPTDQDYAGGGVTLDKDGRLFFSAWEHVYAVNASTGAPIWTLDTSLWGGTDTWFSSGSLGSDGSLYLTTGGSLIKIK